MPHVSALKGGHGVHGQEKVGYGSVEARSLAMVDPGRISICLARSLYDPHAHCLFARVPLLFVSLGHVCLPDWSNGKLQRRSSDSLRSLGYIDLFSRRVREFRVRMGLSIWIFAGFGGSSSYAKVYAALLDGLLPLRFADRAGICSAIFLGGRSSFVFLPCLPGRGPGRGLAQHGSGGNRGQRHSLAHGGKNDYFRSVFAGHVLYMASLVYAVLSFGGDLQLFRLVFPVFPEFS